MNHVVKEWLAECSWKEQTVVLCALRGTDTSGSPELKAMTRWIRRVALHNAAPRKTFMREEPFLRIKEAAETRPLIFDMLPVHFLGHLTHAFEVIGYRHPEKAVGEQAITAYYDLCEYLHVNPESGEQMALRLKDEP